MKRIFFSVASCFLACTLSLAQTVVLNSQGRDNTYVNKIIERSQKIVDALNISDGTEAQDVRNIIANRYFELNDIYTRRDSLTQAVKAGGYKGAQKDSLLQIVSNEKDAALYKTHFAFPAALSLYLNEKQIEQVKNGMTFGVVEKTYAAMLDMIPTLRDDEKKQFYAWLVEARELAMDAESSKRKHEIFGRYKGRFNNYLSKRGYDLTKERDAWAERIKQREAAKAASQGTSK